MRTINRLALLLVLNACTGDNPQALDDDAGADAGADLVVTFADVDLAELAPDLAGELAPDLAELPDLVHLPDLATQPDLFTWAAACVEGATCVTCLQGQRRCSHGIWMGDAKGCLCDRLKPAPCPPYGNMCP